MKIFYDVDTQNDFMNKTGALYVPGAEELKPNLRKLTDFARKNNILMLGSVDRHFGTEQYKDREGELARFGGPFPDHCMNNTEGEKKIQETTMLVGMLRGEAILTDRQFDLGIYVPHLSEKDKVGAQIKWGVNMQKVNGAVHTLEWLARRYPALDEITAAKDHMFPIYFEKQHYDVFTNPAAAYAFEKLLEQPKFEREAVVYGVATDYCVKAAVLGMQARGIQCYVVEDAIKGVDVNPGDTEKAILEMKQAGAKFVKTQSVLEELLK
jgi:nicotinamidase/pyrazinamidase